MLRVQEGNIKVYIRIHFRGECDFALSKQGTNRFF